MPTISEEYSVGESRVRVDCISSERVDRIIVNPSFMTYILAGVRISRGVSKARPDIIWHKGDRSKKWRYGGREVELWGG